MRADGHQGLGRGDETTTSPPPAAAESMGRVCLKAGVHWIEHPDGYWLLRNPQDVTFLQVGADDYTLIRQLELLPAPAVMARTGVGAPDLRRLLMLLSATGMLEGTTPVQRSGRPGFHPLQLLFLRVPLWNPDRWLTRYVHLLKWLWTMPTAGVLTLFLTTSWIVGWHEQTQILITGQKLWMTAGGSLLLPFILLCGCVVALHELAHAFTLKHYGGIVPEIGLLVICLLPGCYTDTTDSYCLVRRRQRSLVVGAGILCQLLLAGIALWAWLLLAPGTWLKTTSYLLLGAALLTLAVNLNPLARFDGYYLAVAATGINNLRARSFLLYAHWLSGTPVEECPRDQGLLALYAPASLLYTLLVFGHLLGWVVEWCLIQIPALSLALLLLWGLYQVLQRCLRI